MQPVSTYRVQLTPGFTFDDCAAIVPYLARLGVTHVYCSPWLESAPDSQHGYDVVDHSQVDSQLGGQQGLDRLVTACRSAGLGIVLDIVPNHMSVAHEQLNAAWTSLLRDGQGSPYASWFDVDWSVGKLVIPVLGDNPELVLHEDRISYHEHQFPLAPGTLVPGDLAATLEQQHYELLDWREGRRLNYRRFFDVTTLAGVRVEVPEVFDQTHALVLQQVRDGVVEGLRVDHPDGLADPEGYLTKLSASAPGTWVIAEKILEPGEALPAWSGHGTTGYDALQQVMGLFVDPDGEAALTALWDGPSYGEVVDAAKRVILKNVLVAEVERLLDVAMPVLSDVTREAMRAALVEVLVAFEVYRAYLPPTGPADEVARTHVEAAVAAARAKTPSVAREAELVGRLALAELDCPEFVTRFQQTCGPVMAKGVEDTAFYRYVRLTALCEVGGDPSVFGTSVEEFHAWCARQQRDWPLSMTTLSTHDTKRSEDVRARLVVLSQQAASWVDAVRRWTDLVPERIDHATEQLVWQTLVGAWPLPEDRALAYVQKAIKEAKAHSSWLAPDEAYEERVRNFVRSVLATPQLVADLEGFVQQLEPAWRLTVLAQKLVQLTMPGVADTYRGTELVDLSLVDPDNRRPVDFARRLELLDTSDGSLDADKLHVTTTALQLRRQRPSCFLSGSYEPLDAGPEALAFLRDAQVAVVVPLRGRVPAGSVSLPSGTWEDLLTGTTWHGSVALDDLLAKLGVALLVRAPVTRFGVWAPGRDTVELHLDGRVLEMSRSGDVFSVEAEGRDYGFSLDGGPVRPDPRSRWQPDGVHGLSRVYDDAEFAWTDDTWTGAPLTGAVVYEMHVGTFTHEGTFEAAISRLDHLVGLGITVVELLPCNAFDGRWGWGYDGVLWFAVHEPYGGPDGLKRFVDAAHGKGLGVAMDVVYNHLGPAGNYLPEYGPYLTETHHTPWGAAVNLENPQVRRYVLDSAQMWLRDFHIDGLRVDAVHALIDDSPTHLLRELSDAAAPKWTVAESDLNDPTMVHPDGMGMTAQWCDDVHHALHVTVTGETSGYYADFASFEVLDKALKGAFVHDGTWSSFRGRPHGSPVPAELGGGSFVVYLQDHDQVGNRAVGDRITGPRQLIGAALYLLSPYVPMVFMGEELGARTPWPFFSDHSGDLGEAVRKGRRAEFASHGWNTDDIPDPQSPATFASAKLDWADCDAHVLDFYKRLIALRKERLTDDRRDRVETSWDHDAQWFVMKRGTVAVACNLSTERQLIPVAATEVLVSSADGWALSERGIETDGNTVVVLAG